MAEYQDRVIEEELELTKKVDKLGKFIGSDVYLKMDNQDKVLMEIQLLYMKAYRDILSRRIIRFE